MWSSCWLIQPLLRGRFVSVCFNLRCLVRIAHPLKPHRLESGPISVQTVIRFFAGFSC